MKRLIIFVLVLSMLMPYTVFAASIEKGTEVISEAAYEAVDEMWKILFASEKKSRADAETAQAVAEAVEKNALYVEDTLRWNGKDHFTFETTTGVTCGYSARLRNMALEAEKDEAALSQPAMQTVSYASKSGTAARDVYLIEPYYGIDGDFTTQYQNEADSIAEATGGTYHLYTRQTATINAVADAIEEGAVVIFDSHGETDFANAYNENDYTSGATTSYILLQTGEGLTDADYAYDYNTYNYHAVNYGGNGAGMYYYAVDGTCIANHMDKEAPNSLLWIAICLGMATDGLHAPLREKGVEVAYGYSQSVTFYYDYQWEEAFFNEMKNGSNVASAIAKMKVNVGYWDWCHEYTDIYTARNNYSAFPIVVSSEDVYPGHGNVDNYQTVYSTWTLSDASKPDVELPGDCLHSSEITDSVDATCTEDGYIRIVCEDCGTVLSEIILEATGHSYVDGVCSLCAAVEACDHSSQTTESVEATCTEDGYIRTVCEDCGAILSETILDATGHSYVDGVCSLCAEVEACDHWIVDDMCQNCGAFCVYVGETINLYAWSTDTDFYGYTWSVADPSIVELSNMSRYTEYADGVWEYRYSVDILGLSRGETILSLYDSIGDLWTTAELVVLSDEPITCEHIWDSGTQTLAPTCTNEGELLYTCLICEETMTTVVPALGHNYLESIITEPTCTTVGIVNNTCLNCLDTYEAELEKEAHHFVDSQCEQCGGFCVIEGETLYLYADFYDDSVYNYTWELRDPSLANLSNPRYEEETIDGVLVRYFNIDVYGLKAGETEIYLLSFAGEEYLPTRLIVLPSDTHVHNYEIYTVDATCTVDGYTTHTCSCGDSYIAYETPALGHTFVGGTCLICDETDPNATINNPFVDVKESDYFYLPVLWAVGSNITNGTSATTFSPNANCTRGQIVTFLWRACGSPEPASTTNPFKDVRAGEYYYKAVLWAVENGITTGLSATSFGPNATCTRGQVATFLWRAQGEPTPQSTTNPFKDVKSGDYYYNAVLWAVENNVTQGVGGGKFAPNASCTRGQIVTFLCRAVVQ